MASENRICWYLFLLILLGFVISKATHLDVPYFWDESWVYGPAVNTMGDIGPTLLPGSFPLEHSRGHPLFFHFLGGIWIKLFGNSLIALHTFALTISICFIATIFIAIKEIISIKVALATCCLLIIQPIFYAQSSMVLPEILLSFLCFLSLIFLHKGNWIGYLLAGSIAIWTKESALAFILCLIAAHIMSMVFNRQFSLKETLLVCLPLLSFLLFLGLNKLTFDFYLYPEHTDMLTLEPQQVIGKLKAIFNNIFIDQKRFPLSITGLLALAYLVYTRQSFFKNELFVYLLFPIVGFSIFSAINFYTVRYILAIFPLVILCIAWLIVEALESKQLAQVLLVVVFIVHSSIQLFDRRSVRDINLSYLDYGPVQLEAVQYFEENNLYGATIQTGFLPSTALTNKYAGYRSNEINFQKVNKELTDGKNYFLFSSVEPHHLKSKVIAHPKSKKLKQIKKGNVEFEIYLLEGKLDQ